MHRCGRPPMPVSESLAFSASTEGSSAGNARAATAAASMTTMVSPRNRRPHLVPSMIRPLRALLLCALFLRVLLLVPISLVPGQAADALPATPDQDTSRWPP